MTEYLRLDALRATPLATEPFAHIVVPGFVSTAGLAAINADYPKIASPGSFPTDQVTFGRNFQTLLDELESDEFREAFEEKFKLDLTGRPTITTVRGRCDAADGKIHTDSKTKIITVLIYMNRELGECGRPAAAVALRPRSQRHHRRGAADCRHPAGVQTQRQFLARP